MYRQSAESPRYPAATETPDCLTSALPPTDMSTYNSKAGQAVRACPVLYYRGICLM